MIKAFVLVVIYNAPYGHAVSFQEFNTLKQCQANAAYLNTRMFVKSAYCTEK